MGIKLSKRCEYGIKAAVHLAKRKDEGYIQSKEIAEGEGMPGKFLESVLLGLRAARVLRSKVGAGGGYKLARKPQEITVRDIIGALDYWPADDETEGSAIGRAAFEYVCTSIEQGIEDAIGKMTLAELLTKVSRSRSRSSSKSRRKR